MGRRAGWSPWPRMWLGQDATEGMRILIHGAGATGAARLAGNGRGEVMACRLTGVNVDGRDSRELIA